MLKVLDCIKMGGYFLSTNQIVDADCLCVMKSTLMADIAVRTKHWVLESTDIPVTNPTYPQLNTFK